MSADHFNFVVTYFEFRSDLSVWLRNRIISAGLEPFLSHVKNGITDKFP